MNEYTGVSNLESIQTDETEYCYLQETVSKYSQAFKVVVPKYMPMMPVQGTPAVVTSPLQATIFINDILTNKPTVSPTINLQNYITIPRHKNSWFRLNQEIFERWTRLVCKIDNKNLRTMYVVDYDFNNSLVEHKIPPDVRNPLYEVLDIINPGMDKVMHVSDGGGISTHKVTGKSSTGVTIYKPETKTSEFIPAYRVLKVLKPNTTYNSYFY